MPDLSIIIINWNTRKLLMDCLASIFLTVQRATYEIFVVDNGSTDGSMEAVAQHYAGVIVIANQHNEGFARANNKAIRRMNGRFAVLLNSDTVLTENALDGMLAFMDAHRKAGMCGPQLLNQDGSQQTSVGSFPTLTTEFVNKSLLKLFIPATYRTHFASRTQGGRDPVLVDFIIGACMMARKEAMDEAGILDEDYFFFYEEIDWCLRMHRAGWPVYHLPQAAIYHLGGGSSKSVSLRARAESWRSRYLFFRKSLKLSRLGTGALFLLGFIQVTYQLSSYTVMNILTLFCMGRLRRRWGIFAYLFLWHLRGRPESMCLPR